MENQKDINEIGGGRLPEHLENEIRMNLPIVLKPALEYMYKVYDEYNDDGPMPGYQKLFLLSRMKSIVTDLINNIRHAEHRLNDEETMMNEAKEKLKAEFKKYL
jgi:hypothetical protein